MVVDNAKCIGCRSCFEACPFGIPQFIEDGTMRKCDMCLDRLERGEKPICVATCPTQALRFGTMGELSRLVAGQVAKKLVDSALP